MPDADGHRVVHAQVSLPHTCVRAVAGRTGRRAMARAACSISFMAWGEAAITVDRARVLLFIGRHMRSQFVSRRIRTIDSSQELINAGAEKFSRLPHVKPASVARDARQHALWWGSSTICIFSRGFMSARRQLMVDAGKYEVEHLLSEWNWLIPPNDTPILISAFGDWVFGKPNGGLWVLSVLDGTYQQVARNAKEYLALTKSPDWLQHTFMADWLAVAASNGLEPQADECLGWQLHPLLGGKFEVANLRLFSIGLYQSLMGQLHLQLRTLPELRRGKKPWYKVW